MSARTNSHADARKPADGSVRSGVVSCVVDPRQRGSDLELFRWYVSLVEFAAVSARDLRVHVVGRTHAPVFNLLHERGVTIREIPSFDRRHGPCNKVGGALALADAASDGLCVLTDSDVVFFEDPRLIQMPLDKVGMRPVDLERPRLDALTKIFIAAGVVVPGKVQVGLGDGQTIVGNGNGGFYVVPADLMIRVAKGWERWSRWLLDRELLSRGGGRVWCADQVAMALALAEEGIGVYEVDRRWNVPTHLAVATSPAPAMLHYHREVSNDGQIMPTGHGAIDELIVRVNETVATAWKPEYARRREGVASAMRPVARRLRSAVVRWVSEGGQSLRGA